MKFICVGAQKAGTTTLDALIRNYASNVEMPKIKETKFFLNEQFNEFNQGEDFYYNKYYSERVDKNNIGEVDPEYLYFESCVDNIYNFNSDMKIIIIVRDPIKRAVSHYEMSKNRGYEELSFEDAIQKENERISVSFFEKNHFSYLTRGKYKEQILRYVNKFGSDNVKVVSFEFFVNNQELVLSDIASFAGFSIDEKVMPLKENTAFSPRFKTLRYLLNSDNIIKRTMSVLVKNKFIKMRVGGVLTKLNSKPRTEKTEISNQTITFLKGYYSEDTEYLAKEYGIEY